MELSVIIPAYDEQDVLTETVKGLITLLDRWKVYYEIGIISNRFRIYPELYRLGTKHTPRRIWQRHREPTDSFGDSIRTGIDHSSGDIIVFVMADGSESPADVVLSYYSVKDRHDMVFCSRFWKLKRPEGYPLLKYILNRISNKTLQHLTDIRCNDLTNGFKAYRREVLEAVLPLNAQGFNIILEIALKAVMKGYKYTTIPVSWTPRKEGKSKFNVRRESWGFIKTFFRVWR